MPGVMWLLQSDHKLSFLYTRVFGLQYPSYFDQKNVVDSASLSRRRCGSFVRDGGANINVVGVTTGIDPRTNQRPTRRDIMELHAEAGPE